MSVASIGSGIESDGVLPQDTELSPEQPIAESEPMPDPAKSVPADMHELRAMIQEDFNAAVADVERRLSQARELERSALFGEPRQIHAEDLNLTKFMIDGYTLTANSPGAGSIAWSSLHVVFMGVDYTIADGNTALKYTWFVKPGSGTTATLQSSNTMPTLGANDALIFVNNSGVPVSVLESSVSYAVGPGVIGNAQLASDVQTLLTNLSNQDLILQGQLDGSITSYYQDAPPWPAGSPSPSGGNVNQGDIWYDSNDGGAFRWTGATPGAGITANDWVRIADTSTAELAGKVNTKVTTYVGSTAPTAPTGGFTTGDLWIDTANNNLIKRWAGSWVALQLGDAAISGIGGAKVGTGIAAGNITTGTLAAARVGSGVTNVSLTGVTGTLPGANLAAGAVSPAKINAAFHILY